MKPKSVQRDIQRSLKKKEADKPSFDLRRVQKTFSITPLRDKFLSSNEDERFDPLDELADPMGAIRRHYWGSVIAFSVISLAVLTTIFFVWILPKFKESRTQFPSVIAGNFIKEGRPSLDDKKAIQLAGRALVANDPDTVKKYFRAGDESPEQILSFLQKIREENGAIKFLRKEPPPTIADPPVEVVSINFEKNPEAPPRLALLTQDANREWKLDFPALARLVTPSWEEIVSKNAVTAQIRVYVTADNYFNGPFANETQWRCYSLKSIDTDAILNGYCKVDSPQAAALSKILSVDSRISRVLISVKRVPDAEDRQLLIERVLAPDWVMGIKPFDEL